MLNPMVPTPPPSPTVCPDSAVTVSHSYVLTDDTSFFAQCLTLNTSLRISLHVISKLVIFLGSVVKPSKTFLLLLDTAWTQQQ